MKQSGLALGGAVLRTNRCGVLDLRAKMLCAGGRYVSCLGPAMLALVTACTFHPATLVFAPGDADTPGDGGGSGAGDASGGDTARVPGDVVVPAGDTGPVSLGAPVQITAGYYHTCALFADGRMKCWGSNSHGQLGLGHRNNMGDEPGEMGEALPFIDLNTAATVLSIGAGHRHTCALMSDHSIRCWGQAFVGDLGNEDQEARGDDPGELTPSYTTLRQPTGLIPQQMTVQKYNICVVYDDGMLYCNGENKQGKLGRGDGQSVGGLLGDMGDGLPPTDLGTGRTVLDHVQGEYHTCALTDDSLVKCYGRNDYGRLGLGDMAHRGDRLGEMGDTLPTVQLGSGLTVEKLYRTYFGACAKLTDGTFRCWGANKYGELGTGNGREHAGDETSDMGDNLLPIDVGADREIAAIRGGFHSICIVFTDKSLACMGLNNSGQLGRGDANDYGDDPGEVWASITAIDLGQGRTLKSATLSSISVGHGHACAVLDDDTFKCWGRNSQGQLGLGDTENRGDQQNEMGGSLAPVRIDGSPIDTITFIPPFDNDIFAANAVVAGSHHVCASTADGMGKCWGGNYWAQLGSGNLRFYGNDVDEMGGMLPTVQVGPTETILQFAPSSTHTCALLEKMGASPSIKCWGTDWVGALGLGTNTWNHIGDQPSEFPFTVPEVNLPAGIRPLSIAASRSAWWVAPHTCALFDDDTLRCWGAGREGQIGGLNQVGNRADSPGEMGENLMNVDLNGDRVTDMALGERFTCALGDSGKVKCFGLGRNGRLGSGNTSSTGWQHASFNSALLPVEVFATGATTNESVNGIYAGVGHACATLSAGGFKCWGRNTFGQLGLGDTLDRGDEANEMGANLPRHGGTTGVLDMALGAHHSCVLFAGGELKCVGAGQRGQLGNESTDDYGGATGENWNNQQSLDFGGPLAVAITAGLDFTCARLDDGQIKCWGATDQGALGDGLRNHYGDEPSEGLAKRTSVEL